MSRDQQRLNDYITHILQAIERIYRYTEFAQKHAEMPWEDIYLMRNRVSHGYFSVDLAVVWKTVQRDIPELRQLLIPLVQKV